MKRSILLAAALTLAAALSAHAQISGNVVKVGVINDQSGPFADFQGPGSVAAARMAVEDFGGKVLGAPIEVEVRDHQNKPDVGVALTRRWMDTEGVDMLVDFGNSAVSLAVQELTRDKLVTIHVSSASDALFGAKCSSTGFVWNYDTSAIAKGVGKAVTQTGGDSWFFIVADYAFGNAMAEQLEQVVTASGGKVVGAVRHPVGTSDFSSFVLQAQSSGAKVVAVLNAGDDTTNTLKAISEFGLVQRGQKVAGTTFYIQNVQALGQKVVQGLQIVTPWYWDESDASREFTKRWRAAMKTDRAPTHLHAGVYSATLAYLNAVKAAGTDDSGKVAAKMHELGATDAVFGKNSVVRADGRLMKDMHLVEVKSPDRSKYPWDYYDIKAHLAAADIIRPLADGKCPFIK